MNMSQKTKKKIRWWIVPLVPFVCVAFLLIVSCIHTQFPIGMIQKWY